MSDMTLDSSDRDSLQTELDALLGVKASLERKLARGHLPAWAQETWSVSLAHLDDAIQAVDCQNQCGQVAVQVDGLDGKRCEACQQRAESRVA